MKTLNIIGAGNVGKVLGKTFAKNNIFKINQIKNRTLASAENAVKFIQDGSVAKTLKELREADVWMISTPDDLIETTFKKIHKLNIIKKDNIIFHTSGAYSSKILSIEKKAFLASIHPVKSFSDINESYKTLNESFIGIEGDIEAINFLNKIFSTLNINTFKISSENKLIYHAGSVFACNYLTSLLDISFECFKDSGVDKSLAIKIIAPLIKETLNNNLNLSSKEALSGPIKRKDYNLYTKQYEELKKNNLEISKLYKLLGERAKKIADS